MHAYWSKTLHLRITVVSSMTVWLFMAITESAQNTIEIKIKHINLHSHINLHVQNKK